MIVKSWCPVISYTWYIHKCIREHVFTGYLLLKTICTQAQLSYKWCVYHKHFSIFSFLRPFLAFSKNGKEGWATTCTWAQSVVGSSNRYNVFEWSTNMTSGDYKPVTVPFLHWWHSHFRLGQQVLHSGLHGASTIWSTRVKTVRRDVLQNWPRQTYRLLKISRLKC